MPEPDTTRSIGLRAALGLSAVLLLLRLELARRVGFGDAEALYACYALHPQPAYLDHPGLVGALARFIGGGGAPTPEATHRFTALVATAIPWLGYAAALLGGATARGARRTLFALALWPEMSIGLFALTPDLPLASLWIATLGLLASVLRSDAGSRAALFATVTAGLLAGLAVNAKASGVLLVLVAGAAFATRPGRAHLRTVAPWCGAFVVVLLAYPVVRWEWDRGFPMLAHRFVATQGRSGFSLRNAGALVGGQLLYVTPPLLILAYRAVRALPRRTDNPLFSLFWLATVIPGVPLAALCLWSRVAEPHWMAPAYLGLALSAAFLGPLGTGMERAAVGVGLAAPVLTYVLVTTPLYPKLAGTRYVPKYDLVNDLYAWQAGLPLLEDELARAAEQSRDAIVVGPHWTVCAQVHAALGSRVPVGCRTKQGDDFSNWYPERTWKNAPTILFVTDDRFDVEARTAFPDRDVVSVQTARAYRGGRSVRSISVSRLDRRAITHR